MPPADPSSPVVTRGHPEDRKGHREPGSWHLVTPDDFQLRDVSWVRVEDLVTPHLVGRVLCNECGGTGELPPDFQLRRTCDPCDGTGWMGGDVKIDSSEKRKT